MPRYPTLCCIAATRCGPRRDIKIRFYDRGTSPARPARKRYKSAATATFANPTDLKQDHVSVGTGDPDGPLGSRYRIVSPDGLSRPTIRMSPGCLSTSITSEAVWWLGAGKSPRATCSSTAFTTRCRCPRVEAVFICANSSSLKSSAETILLPSDTWSWRRT